MNKSSVFFLLLSITLNLFSQIEKAEKWKTAILQNKHKDKEDILNQLLKYDFSKILNSTEYKNARLGFIGDNFQRIKIQFVSIIKNSDLPNEYFVYGTSNVKNNICEFQGTIRLEIAKYYSGTDFRGLKQGFVIASYIFYENPMQNHVGVFKGLLKSDFYIDMENNLNYNDLTMVADGFKNNQFVGSWMPYSGQKAKACNWGDFRIPFSGDLDQGCGEFFPNEKYFQFGWKEYMMELGYKNENE